MSTTLAKFLPAKEVIMPPVASGYKRRGKHAEYVLSWLEEQQLMALAEKAQGTYDMVSNSRFLENLSRYMVDLPRDLAIFLMDVRLRSYDYAVVSGIEIHDDALQPTPPHWNFEKGKYARTLEFVHFLMAAMLGYPYGWKTQQNGKLVNDVVPIQGYEDMQQGFGSSAPLRFHTEDPFHVARADYVTLMCLRNQSRTPTTLFPIDLASIPDEYKQELFKEQYPVMPDEAHTMLTYDSSVVGESFKDIMKDFNWARHISVLSGNYDDPYLRIDPTGTDLEGVSPKAREAYQYLCDILEHAEVGVELKPGDLVIVNNHQIAHGRGKFQAHYSGKDRWLQRVLVLEDLRKTAEYRNSNSDHVIVR